ncbi:MAG: Crp/Fnr family transcriptional regulator [Spirochaetota bacterium]
MDLSIFDKYAKVWDASEIIFLEYEPGDKFYLIQTGKVKIVKIIGDIEKNIDILLPGDIFGEMAILEQQPRSATAIAAERSRLLEFTKENFEIILKGNPALALKLLKVFSKRIFDAKRRLMILQLPEPEYRVADCLLMFAEQANIPRDQYVHEQEFSATIEDVANWCGLAPAEAQKLLANFLKTGKLEIFEKRIVVKNLNEFQRMIDMKRNKKQ